MSSHESYRALLDDFVDGALSASSQARLQSHLDTCDECRRTVQELAEIDRLAGALERLEAPQSLWPKIQRSLEPEAGARKTSSPAGATEFTKERSTYTRRRTSNEWMAWLVAASVLLFLGANLWVLRTGGSTDAGSERADRVAYDLRLAEAHYLNALVGLQSIFDESSQNMDPALSGMLRDNLDLIEASIAESRAALNEDPTSRVAQESLMEGLRLKVNLLQNIILLMNEVRKGDGEGAFGLIESLRAAPNLVNP